MSKLTDSFRTVGIFNPHGFYGDEPYISYTSDLGRGGRGQFWSVTKRGVKLSDHWRDHGSRTFSLFVPGGTFAERKATALTHAQAWACERFGVIEWARDPYGCYGPAGFVKTRLRDLKARARAAA